MSTDPVEVTTKYVTTVDTLQHAFSFVMSHLDAVGSQPHIEIQPISRMDLDDPEDTWTEHFTVIVEGMNSYDAEKYTVPGSDPTSNKS